MFLISIYYVLTSSGHHVMKGKSIRNSIVFKWKIERFGVDRTCLSSSEILVCNKGIIANLWKQYKIPGHVDWFVNLFSIHKFHASVWGKMRCADWVSNGLCWFPLTFQDLTLIVPVNNLGFINICLFGIGGNLMSSLDDFNACKVNIKVNIKANKQNLLVGSYLIAKLSIYKDWAFADGYTGKEYHRSIPSWPKVVSMFSVNKDTT